MISEKFRVWHIQNVPNDPIYYYCQSIKKAKRAIRWLIELDLMRKDVTSNAFGLEERIGITDEGREWEEWSSEHGDSIMDRIDEESH